MWIVMLEIGTFAARMSPLRPLRPPHEGGIAFRDPNECLYQFVSIVFEYFCAFVTIVIPCGCGRKDRCFLFNISFGFYFNCESV